MSFDRERERRVTQERRGCKTQERWMKKQSNGQKVQRYKDTDRITPQTLSLTDRDSICRATL